MKLIRVAIFALVALVQLAVPAWAVWTRTQTLAKGKIWKFRVAPVDPVDAVRGRYVTLSFVAQKVPQAQPLPPADFAYALLKEDSRGFAEIDRLSMTAMRGDNVVRVVPAGWRDGAQHVTLPFDRFWLNEKLGPEADRAYAQVTRQENGNAYVTVRVHDGDAALEQLYIDDRPIIEYLRGRPQP